MNDAGSYIAEELTSGLHLPDQTITSTDQQQIISVDPITSPSPPLLREKKVILTQSSITTKICDTVASSSTSTSSMLSAVVENNPISEVASSVEIAASPVAKRKRISLDNQETISVGPSTVCTGTTATTCQSQMSKESDGESYFQELAHDYECIARKNEAALLNSLPHLKTYLETAVNQYHLEYNTSLLFSREDEIYNAQKQYEDEFDIIKTFITIKYP